MKYALIGAAIVASFFLGYMTDDAVNDTTEKLELALQRERDFYIPRIQRDSIAKIELTNAAITARDSLELVELRAEKEAIQHREFIRNLGGLSLAQKRALLLNHRN